MFLFCLIPINLSDPFIQLIKAEIGASAVGDSRCPSESRKKLKAEDENRWNNVTSSASFYVARIWTVTRFQAYEIGTFLSSDIVLKGQCMYQGEHLLQTVSDRDQNQRHMPTHHQISRYEIFSVDYQC